MWSKLKPLSNKVLRRFERGVQPTDEWRAKVSPDDVRDFGDRNGKRAIGSALSKLGKYQPYYNILTSKIGQAILGDALEQCNFFLLKIINDDATAADRAEYRAYRRIIDRQLEKIYSYIKIVDRVRGK